MAGEGHADWIGGVAFHPSGSSLATASGDGTVKVWDFATSACSQTLTGHGGPVWSVAWHDTGAFLLSGCVDHVARVFDVAQGVPVATLRGHVDSINAVGWIPYSNLALTCSGDKTCSTWDARTGLCAQTFYGHLNAINGIVPSPDGHTLASVDADGVCRLWDIRMVAEKASWSVGPHPLNAVAFDRSSGVLALGSDDGTIKVVDTNNESAEVKVLSGHTDAVQSLAFDPFNKWLVSSSSDGTFRYWA